jgi:hypothetical protein
MLKTIISNLLLKTSKLRLVLLTGEIIKVIFDKGHLCPAGDMEFDVNGYNDTFDVKTRRKSIILIMGME